MKLEQEKASGSSEHVKAEAETHTSRHEESVKEIEKKKRSQEVSTAQKMYLTKNEKQDLRKRMAACVGLG